MKAYAIARWLVALLDEEQRDTAREKISKEGVYSAFHGKWWLRLTKRRGDYFGQIDALGIGRVVHMMEDIKKKAGLNDDQALERFALLTLNLNEFVYLD